MCDGVERSERGMTKKQNHKEKKGRVWRKERQRSFFSMI